MSLSNNAISLLKTRYCHTGETPKDVYTRVANALSLGDRKFEAQLKKAMLDGIFLPNSPCIRNAGQKNGMLHACFCLPIQDNMESIGKALNNMIIIFKNGGGVGINFSKLRPKEAVLSGGGSSSGVVSFMGLFNTATEVVKQGGFRRGALMGILNFEHAEIMEFIRSKLTGKLTNFNISVLVSDVFMQKVEKGETIDLINPQDNKIWATVNAKTIFDVIAFSAWNSGDPGFLFYDRINKDNTLFPKIKIKATNPCFTGDTLVAVADGRDVVTIKQLAEEGKDVPVFCSNKKGKVTVKTMRNPRKTGENLRIVKVNLDNGHSLRVTENHKFILSDGSTKEAINLCANDSLSIMNKVKATIDIVFEKNTNSKSQNYYWINSSNFKNFQGEHRLICEFFTKKNLKNKVVHHIDFNGLNNKPENLSAMSKKEHDSYHDDCIKGDLNPMRRFPEKNWMNNPLKQQEIREKYHIGKKRSIETRNRISEAKKKQHQNPEILNRISVGTKLGMLKHKANFLDAIRKSRIRWAEKRLKECQEKTDLKCVLVNNIVCVQKYCEGCKKELILPWNNREISFHKKCFHENYGKIYARNRVKAYTNHKVISVQFDGYEDVYSGTVDEFHNLYIGGFSEKYKNYDSKVFINTWQCGEVPLPDYGACCLGSINLSKLVRDGKFKFNDFEKYLEIAVRALRNNNAVSWYPLPEITKVMKELDPIGVGIMGFADCLIKLGIRYDSEECLKFIDEIGIIYKKATDNLAKNCFWKRIIAPTGSLSILADCSSGIEPIFDTTFERHLTVGVMQETRDIYKSKHVRTAHQISPEWHLKVQAQWQKWVDGSISKTINMPNEASVDDVKNAYLTAWKMGCKGITIFRNGCKEGVLKSKPKCDGDSCQL